MDEGVIKFKFSRKNIELDDSTIIRDLIDLRDFAHDKGFVGVYNNGIGFGNVSLRKKDLKFYITGSQTGHIKHLTKNDIVEVKSVDIDRREVLFLGLINGSSESISHFNIYERSKCSSIAHIHHKRLWNYMLKNNFTKVLGEYGSSELANNLSKLSEGKECGIFVMSDHEDGIIIFGTIRYIKEQLNSFYQLIGKIA
ncbi:MAG: hypothetical protein CR982_02105 [Candidatus Cloacimonadota bacterium]|nr:MAG: hypothetical protein CR982_02105 [Candidatus Cloacimonadota bacterium]PIE80821.1 MAG: hypothetical protein CSA15_01435 [Candidatus Delongbacteria bacterium]